MKVLKPTMKINKKNNIPPEKLKQAEKVSQQYLDKGFPFIQNDFLITMDTEVKTKTDKKLLETFNKVLNKSNEKFPGLQMPQITLPINGGPSPSFQKARAQLRRIVRKEPEIAENLKKMVPLMKKSNLVKKLQKPTNDFLELSAKAVNESQEILGTNTKIKPAKINLAEAFEDMVNKVVPKPKNKISKLLRRIFP